MGDYPNTILLAQELYTLSQIWFYFEDRGYDLYYWHISIDLYSNYILTVQFHCEYRGRVSGSVFIIFLLHWYCFNNCPALSALLTQGQSQCFWQRKELNEKSSRISQIIKSSVLWTLFDNWVYKIFQLYYQPAKSAQNLLVALPVWNINKKSVMI